MHNASWKGTLVILYIGVAAFLDSQPGPIYSSPGCSTASAHPFHPISLCTGILGQDYLDFPHSSMSLNIFLKTSFFFHPRILNSPTYPFLPLWDFPYGNGVGSSHLRLMVNLFFSAPRPPDSVTGCRTPPLHLGGRR